VYEGVGHGVVERGGRVSRQGGCFSCCCWCQVDKERFMCAVMWGGARVRTCGGRVACSGADHCMLRYVLGVCLGGTKQCCWLLDVLMVVLSRRAKQALSQGMCVGQHTCASK
jgi:hypothetical protein